MGVRRGVTGHVVGALAQRGRVLFVDSSSAETRRLACTARWFVVRMAAADSSQIAAERRVECGAALSTLQLELPELLWLASWPVSWLNRLRHALPEPLRSRALHIVSEATRVRFAAELLAAGEVERFGTVMYESHESARRLFSTGDPEADVVVNAARDAGAAGARLLSDGNVMVLIAGRSKSVPLAVQRAITRACVRSLRRQPEIQEITPSFGLRLERRAALSPSK
jgi:galactokinase